jgi:hypothetical protein
MLGKVVSNPAVREALGNLGREAGQQLLQQGSQFIKGKLGIGGAMSGGAPGYSGGAAGMSGGAASGGRRRGLDARLC